MPPPITTAPPGCGSDTNNNKKETWTSRFDRLDEAISKPIFRLGLPKWIEFVLSVPANVFGTSACLSVGPLWIAVLELSEQQQQEHDRIVLLRCVSALATFGYLVAWGCLQLVDGCDWLGKRLFWNKLHYALAYPWVLSVLAVTTVGTSGRAIYPLVLWPPVVVLMNYLKASTKRKRPARKDLERRGGGGNNNNHGDWIFRKKFPSTSYFLAEHSGHESYPSGDVMMATLLSIPLWDLGRRNLAVAIALSSGFGRMYVLAHHLSDVLSGAAFTLAIHKLVAAMMHHQQQDTKWWHPLLALAGFVALELYTQKDMGAAIRESSSSSNGSTKTRGQRADEEKSILEEQSLPTHHATKRRLFLSNDILSTTYAALNDTKSISE